MGTGKEGSGVGEIRSGIRRNEWNWTDAVGEDKRRRTVGASQSGVGGNEWRWRERMMISPASKQGHHHRHRVFSAV